MKKVLFILLFAATPILAFADATSTVSTSSPQAATITIRDGDITAFTGIVELAASTTPPVDIAPTNSSSTVAVPADSLLATLVALDATTTDFDITDLAYFSSFNSFIINCIAISIASTTPHCFNWTYAVNSSFPQVGVDHTLLENGDIVHIFFGPPRQTVLSTTTATVGEKFIATAQSYNLETGIYGGSSGVTVGVGISNPDFSFTEFATSTTDENGEAFFTMNATGTFAVGIQEDFYFPSVSITITEVPATTTPPESPPPSEGGSPSTGSGPSSGGGGITHSQLNVPSALAYLISNQHADGSFDSPLLSDWAALALVSTESGAAKELLRSYLLTATPALVSVTDYERHAMALLALGINPYSGTATNYIAPIVSAFDGTQIGETSLDNDDIFTLFPLLHAGYGASDDIIQKTVAFIISRQQASGAWDSSVDVTAAAVQALTALNSLSGVSAAIAKAEQYLHTQQQSNGGWGNSFSTSWALQAIHSLGQSPDAWAPSGYNPNDFLASLQYSDGGIESVSIDAQTRTWATEYAIPASLGKTWNFLLSSFSRPSTATDTGGGAVLGAATSTNSGQATSTISQNATTTPLVATSTPHADLASTSTPTTTPSAIQTSEKAIPKKIAPQTSPQPVTTTTIASPSSVAQTASAGNVDGNFLRKIWHSIISFFAWVF